MSSQQHGLDATTWDLLKGSLARRAKVKFGSRAAIFSKEPDLVRRISNYCSLVCSEFSSCDPVEVDGKKFNVYTSQSPVYSVAIVTTTSSYYYNDDVVGIGRSYEDAFEDILSNIRGSGRIAIVRDAISRFVEPSRVTEILLKYARPDEI